MLTSHAPALISIPRITLLACATLVALSSGTNYIYSGKHAMNSVQWVHGGTSLTNVDHQAYAPQLGARLHITHTQLNIVGLAGNAGTYLTAPILGRVVDSRGPRILLVTAFVLLLGGYSGIRGIYDAGLPPGDKTLSPFSFYSLAFCGFITGVAANAGLASAVNATAKSFPDRARGTTTALVISGFGLSAFLFSTIAHIAFSGDTSSFLLLLALGTSFPMILGFFLVHPIPLPASELEHSTYVDGGGAAEAASAIVFEREDDSRTALLSQVGTADVEHSNSSPDPYSQSPADPSDHAESRSEQVELSPTRATFSVQSLHHPRQAEPNVSGLKMLATLQFWLLSTTMMLLTGTGLMYINNVGSISHALLAKANPDYDENTALRWQATQVSVVSVANCLGRILIGLAADITKTRLKRPRTYCVVMVSCLFVLSQLICIDVDDVRDLWKGSVVLGLAYGGIFGLFPTIMIEYFGLPHFSENWGVISLSPLVGGNFFSITFGRNLDAHTPLHHTNATSLSPSPSRWIRGLDLPSSHQCLDGRECYVSSLRMTVAACLLALALSTWAAYRDRQKMVAGEYTKLSRDAV